MQLDANVALITGAGRGLGRELAIALARCGVAIAAIDRDEAGLVTLEEEIRAAHCGQVTPHSRNESSTYAWELADVTDAPSMSAKVALLEERLGPIDLVVANAGIGRETPAHDFRAEDIHILVNVNLLGVANTIAAVLPGMIERRRGHIVGISSLASLHGLPRMIGYCASKAGVNALLESLRLEVKKHNIAVTTVCPGYMPTPMNAQMTGAAPAMTSVEDAVSHIVEAIHKRRAFCAFPRGQAWGLFFVRLLPRWLRDWLVMRNMPAHLERAEPPAKVAVPVPVLEHIEK